MTNNNWFVCILCYCKFIIDTGKIPSLKKVYVSFNVTTKIIKCQLFSLNIVCSIMFFKKQVILHLKCSVSSTVTKFEHCHYIRYCTI